MGLKHFRHFPPRRISRPALHCGGRNLEAGRLAAHWTLCGTHMGLFLGNPFYRQVVAKGTIFAQTADNQIIEVWILIDQMGMLQQLGIVPPPRGSEGVMYRGLDISYTCWASLGF